MSQIQAFNPVAQTPLKFGNNNDKNKLTEGLEHMDDVPSVGSRYHLGSEDDDTGLTFFISPPSIGLGSKRPDLVFPSGVHPSSTKGDDIFRLDAEKDVPSYPIRDAFRNSPVEPTQQPGYINELGEAVKSSPLTKVRMFFDKVTSAIKGNPFRD